MQLATEQRRELESWLRKETIPVRQVRRARIVLLAAEGLTLREIASEVGCDRECAGLWRARFLAAGVDGLVHDAPGRGRKRTYDEAAVTALLALAVTKPGNGSTHWSTRDLATKTGMSQSTVSLLLRRHKLQPHRTRSFKFSKDPELREKVVDIVGLYLDPPKRAVVLSVDEKPQMQVLQRAQGVLPVRPGTPEGRSHDYIRHGTSTLFAALDVHTGHVTKQHRLRHRHQEFLAFMDHVVASYPETELHVVLDNFRTHKQAATLQWLQQHPLVHLHYTPVGASWMNQVETWFSILQRKVITRGTFPSLRSLLAKVQRFIEEWNRHPHPFRWVKTADEILPKASRLVICESVH